MITMKQRALPAEIIFALLFAPLCGVAAEPVLLWPDGAPGATGDSPADRPELSIYRPEVPNGAGVVICPGGGYGILASDHEGHQVARWLNSIGVAGFVLKYRHAPRYRHPAPLADVQRAIRYVRRRAEALGVAPGRIGVMGFSAGGHLASTAATHFDEGDPDSDDPIERLSSRPDFAILAYPVISLTAPFAHRGSARNLLGEDPDPELARSLSNETQVTVDTPPTFLFHTQEDPAVPVENSLAFFHSLRAAQVPAEMHIYQSGPHGVGLGVGDPALATWPGQLHGWLKSSGFLSDDQRMQVSGTVTLDRQPLRWGMVRFTPAEPNQPAAFAIVSRGKYDIPAERGAVVGANRIVVFNLGAVAPRPTVDDVQRLDADFEVLVRDDKKNIFDFELTTP